MTKILYVCDGQLGFDHLGTFITNPWRSENTIDRVDPDKYYGLTRYESRALAAANQSLHELDEVLDEQLAVMSEVIKFVNHACRPEHKPCPYLLLSGMHLVETLKKTAEAMR